jgi:predicted alpha/beta hydrolase family esterase
MPKQKTQILLIHGADTHRNRREYLHWLKTQKISIKTFKKWSGEYLDTQLGKSFQIIRPQMPLKENAQYEDWKIHFERFFPFLRNNLILVGGSLGGVFLAKYLSENKFPKKILATYLICPPFDDTLPKEHLTNRFTLKKDLSRIEKNSPRLTLMFSRNDDIVPVAHAKKYASKLNSAKIIIYKDKNGHFVVPTFPEIVRMIKKVTKENNQS